MPPSLNHPTKLASTFLALFLCALAPTALTLIFFNKTFLFEWTIMNLNSSPISMALILDPCGALFSCLVILISLCVMIFSTSYMSHDPFLSRFIWLVMLFVLSMNLLIFIPNLMAILLGWDGLGLISFLLVIYYQNPKSLAAGMITILMNRIGDVMILLSIAWSLTQGHWNILHFFQTPLSLSIILALLVAAMTKSAQIPFSSWLPAAMAAPTPVSALVHSSTLVTAGVFLLIRFYPFLSQADIFTPTLLIIASATMLMAGISAMFESDLKKIIALSTLSQLGVMMAALGLGLLQLALFHLMTHALFKALLFLCAGNIIHQGANNQDLRLVGALWKQLPLSMSCLNIANLALMGTPFLAGFYSKDAILEFAAGGSTNLLISIMLILATIFTATYSFRFALSALWGNSNAHPLHSISDSDAYMTAPMIILTLMAICGGAWIGWLFLPALLEPVLPPSLKLAALIATISGVWVALFIMSSSSLSIHTPMTTHSSSSMWFMSLISAQPIMIFPLKLGHSLLKSLDHGWWEILAGQGLFSSNKALFQTLQPTQALPLTALMITSFILSFIFLSSLF